MKYPTNTFLKWLVLYFTFTLSPIILLLRLTFHGITNDYSFHFHQHKSTLVVGIIVEKDER